MKAFVLEYKQRYKVLSYEKRRTVDKKNRKPFRKVRRKQKKLYMSLMTTILFDYDRSRLSFYT